jgi:LmbE family N-acetylglucosaminyl deacetylase
VSPSLGVVAAHPDDDTFMAAGTAALHADDDGWALTVVLVTSGDAGQIADPSLATPETLARVREAEDRASWAALGVPPDRHEFLRYRDEHVADVPRAELVQRMARILAEVRPDVVVTFGPEGITEHADHVRTGEAATEAFHRARGASSGGFERLLHMAIPQSRLRSFSDRLVERGMDPIDSTQPYQPRGVPDETIAIEVDCSSVWRRKLAALREHRTQGSADMFPEDIARDFLGAEWFVQSWPERPEGTATIRDVFEGLGASA